MFEKLVRIQQELKAPKNQRNNFGKYNYRSLEDIMEAVKPLLKREGLVLTFRDEVLEIAGIPVLQASAILTDGESEYSVTSSAGVDINRKGMDISQSFGASSSYARKYAANGLFLIDDTKDADSTNTHGKSGVESKLPVLKKGTPDCIKCINRLKDGGTMSDIEKRYTITPEMKAYLTK